MRTAKTLIRLGGCPADLSLRWAHTHFVGFDMSRLKFVSAIMHVIDALGSRVINHR